MEYGKNRIGQGCTIFEPFTLGFPSRERMGSADFPGVTLGDNAVLRSGGTIYCDVSIGNHFQCGHSILIRENTAIGDHVAVGTATIIEGNCQIGNNVRIQSMAFVPTHTTIGDGVFIGPHSILTNDKYPPASQGDLKGPILEDNAVIGANAIILPGIRIGKGAAVAAGAVVTHDVPAGMMAMGVPAKIQKLPNEMRRR